MTKTLAAAALLGALALPALAQTTKPTTGTDTGNPNGIRTLACQTRGYCTNDLSCSPDTEVLLVDLLPDGNAVFGWESLESRFTGLPLHKPGFTIYLSLDGVDSVQNFTLADDMTATMSVQAMIFDQLYHSIQSLTCVESVG